MHRNVHTGVIILIVGFIIINYILEELIFEEKRLNEISENKFSSKITHYTVANWWCYGNKIRIMGKSFGKFRKDNR